MRLRLALSTFAIACALVTGAATAQTYNLCVSQQPSFCPPGYDKWIGCQDAGAWANAACKVQGSNEPAKYTSVVGPGGGGGQCGYRGVTITCR
jgi:hypothetical protein